MNKILENREFRLWDYNVSHSKLLLRSQKSEVFPSSVDIIFWDVSAMKIPVSIGHLINLEKLSVEDNLELYNELAPGTIYHGTDLFKITSNQGEFYVIAWTVSANFNTLNYDESSISKLDMEWFEHNPINIFSDQT